MSLFKNEKNILDNKEMEYTDQGNGKIKCNRCSSILQRKGWSCSVAVQVPAGHYGG